MNFILQNLYTNEAFRYLFFNRSKDLVENFFSDLTDEEKISLSFLDEAQLDFFSDSLKRKTMDVVERPFRVLFSTYPSLMKRIFFRFYFICRLFPNDSHLQYIEKFGQYLKQYFNESGEIIFYNIAKYITQKMQAKSNPLPNYKVIVDCSVGLKPVLSNQVKIDSYDFDMTELLKVFPNESESNEKYYMMSSDIFFCTDVVELSKPIYFFMQLCDGFFSLEDIYARLSMKFSISEKDVSNQISSFLEKFIERGIIYFRDKND